MPSEYSFFIPYYKTIYSQEMVDAVVDYMQKEGELQYRERNEECELFENEFAEYCGKKYAISTNSGTASMHVSLLACGIGQGDEVILTPHVAYAIGNSVISVGAKPVFVDIDSKTLTIDPLKIEGKITSNTKAIIPVHTYGHPADMDPIIEIAKKHDLNVIEDVTHAIISEYKGKRLPIGSDRCIGIFSFNGKQIWLPSGGGMLVSDNEEFAKKASMYRNPHSGSILGYSYMMADSAAVVGRIQIRQLEKYAKMQRSSAKILDNLLKDTPVFTPLEESWAYHSYARYAILAPNRDELLKFLKQCGICCKALYSMPTHLLKYYIEKFGYSKGDFPVTEKVKMKELSLPEPRFRSRLELEYISNKIAEFYTHR